MATKTIDLVQKGLFDQEINGIKNDYLKKDDFEQTFATYFERYFKTKIDLEYPEGSIYITTGSLPSFFDSSEWELIESNRALWTGNDTNVGTKIEAGIPNIKGQFRYDVYASSRSGACYNGSSGIKRQGCSTDTGSADVVTLFLASKGEVKLDGTIKNDVYGKSDTVQPAAYVVKVYKRIKVNKNI